MSTVRPMISTPGPRQSMQLNKSGASVQQVITPTDIVLPSTNTAESTIKIPAGQKILLIKTSTGNYMRTNDGKIFAVHFKRRDGDKSDFSTTTSTNAFVEGTTATTQAQIHRMVDQSVMCNSLPQQVTSYSPQARQSHSPQSSQAVVHSPHSYSSHPRCPLPHSPLTQLNHSLGLSVSQQTQGQSSQLLGNNRSAPLQDVESGFGSSAACEALFSNQSNPPPAFMGLSLSSSQYAHHYRPSPTSHSQKSQQFIHFDPIGHAQSQVVGHPGRQASYVQRQQGGPQLMYPTESPFPSSHPQAPESWGQPNPSSSLPSPLPYNPHPQTEQGQRVMHPAHPAPPQQDDDSSFSLNQGDCPLSDKWINSGGWTDDGNSGQGEDQHQFMGQAEQSLPPPSPAQQSLSAFLADSTNA